MAGEGLFHSVGAAMVELHIPMHLLGPLDLLRDERYGGCFRLIPLYARRLQYSMGRQCSLFTNSVIMTEPVQPAHNTTYVHNNTIDAYQ